MRSASCCCVSPSMIRRSRMRAPTWRSISWVRLVVRFMSGARSMVRGQGGIARAEHGGAGPPLTAYRSSSVPHFAAVLLECQKIWVCFIVFNQGNHADKKIHHVKICQLAGLYNDSLGHLLPIGRLKLARYTGEPRSCPAASIIESAQT